MKTNKLFIWALLAAGMVLTACSNDDMLVRVGPYIPEPVVNYTVPEDDGGKYTEKLVNVNRGGTYDGQVTLRFYETQPNVAYIAAAEFHRMMMPGAVMLIEKQGGLYQLSTADGEALVNVYDDILETNSIIDFTNLMSLARRDMPSVYLDGAPFVRYKSLAVDNESMNTTFDFRKYNIDLHGDADNVYFPFSTLSDMYADLAYHFAGYNGERIVINDNPCTTSTLHEVDNEFTKAVYQRESTTDDMARFRYNELCFAIDYFYGRPGRSSYEPLLKEKGLDAMLDDQGEEGKEVKKLLQSKNTVEFALGMDALQYYLDDGGHTEISLSGESSNKFAEGFNDRCKAAAVKYPKAKALSEKAEKVFSDYSALRKEITESRQAAIGNELYVKKGNTALCVFNTFQDIEWKAWKAYYAGGEKPTLEKYPKDDLLILLDGLQKAEADPEVQNFVIDIATNGGGSLDIVMTLTSLLAEKAEAYAETTLTNQRYTAFYDIDRNFDGKFDAKDKDVKYNLNVAVLTSGCSFSCANQFPSLMKDFGKLIIGEKSGGGSCAIQQMCTADGFDYRISSFRCRMCDKNGKNIDGGIEPHKVISRNQFYDIEALGKIIDEYYKTK